MRLVEFRADAFGILEAELGRRLSGIAAVIATQIAPESVALLAAGEVDFARRNIRTVEIGVLSGNHRAQDAYKALGYRPYSSQLRKRL